MKTKLLIAFIACLIAGSATAQIDLSMKKNPIYVVTPIHVTSDQKHEQRTFAAMRAPLIKKVSENPKVQVVEDRACVNKLLTVIQNLKKFTQRDSTNGKVYYKLEFHYALAIKNTEKNEVIAQGSTKKGYAQSEKSFADAFASACNKIPYDSDFNDVAEEAFALVGLITKIEPDAKKPNRAGLVHINLGKNHGLRSNQWFDVFVVVNGNVSDRVATLHLDKAGALTSVCKVKKGKDELLTLWNNNPGVKFAVVSRMESNIFKKLEKSLDFFNTITDVF